MLIKLSKTRKLQSIFLLSVISILVCFCVNTNAVTPDPYEDFMWFGKQIKEKDPAYLVNVKAYEDPEKDINELKANYTTFTFDYASKQNPLLEKELFKTLEKLLLERGMARDEENPAILISMHYYIGKKEDFVPPQSIISTRLKFEWTGGIMGSISAGHKETVPVTGSKTTQGETQLTYYRDIRLYFLDFQSLQGEQKPEIPPLVFVGEVNSAGKSDDIRDVAQVMLKEVLTEYPEKTALPAERSIGIMCRSYGDIGIKTLKDNWKIIKEIVPGSPADKAGLKPGDTIEKINGKKTTSGYDSWCHSSKAPKVFGDEYMKYIMKFYEEDPYNKFVILNIQNQSVKFKVKTSENKKQKELSITPEVKTGCRYYRGQIVRDNYNYDTIPLDWIQIK